MKIDLLTEDQARRERLLAIYDHVGEIAKKIAAMDDPLPHQLERSVPSYLEALNANAQRLTHSKCHIVIAGENSSDKSYVINALLGEDLLPCFVDASTAVICEISYDTENWSQVHFWDTSLDPIVLKDGGGFGEELARFVQATDAEMDDWPYQRAEIFTRSPVIQDGVVIVDTPIVGKNDVLTRQVAEKIYDCAALVYVLECTSSGEIQADKMMNLMRVLSNQSPGTGFGKKFLPVASVVFVFCCPDQASMGVFVREMAIKKLKEYWPGVDESQIFFLCTAECLSPLQKEMTSTEFFKFLACLERLALNYLEHRITLTNSWMQQFVSRVLHHLRAFLNQSEKSQEDRFGTFSEIQLRLNQLTYQADEFFHRLRHEVDGKVEEATTLLRNHLVSDEVMARISVWTEEEIPNEQIWQEVETSIRERISHKLYVELSRWEEEKKFFKNLRPHLIKHFQKQFAGIEKQLTMVENMISRHDSRICLLDICDSPNERDTDQCIGFLPQKLNLNIGQKIALGVAAPFLVPIALTIAVLGLPIIGGMAAKDLIIEKIAENRLKEYNADKMKFLKKKTPEEIRKFVKSKALEKYIRTQLRPAYRCIEQLEEVVPGQIDADKCQVESLCNDAREAKDFARFYQPLVEIFEYDKQMLTLFRVMHMQRERVDLKFSDVTQPQTVRTICQGLSSTIRGDFWVDDDIYNSKSKRAVSLRQLNVKLEPSTVEDYLLEEEAYRWQACPHIVKFYGVTKDSRYLYHIIEPLSCSLRHFLNNAPEAALEVSDKNRFNFLKSKMVEVVRGLEYVHDRGWVHYDLSLDSVAVDASATIKLTNISSRRMIKIERDLPRNEIQNYAHLPHEVIVDPPAAYTSSSEMYSVGILMWEMWTFKRAFEDELCTTEEQEAESEKEVIDTIDKFAMYVEINRPRLDTFLSDSGEPLSRYGEIWMNYMQQCWAESERLTSKAWLQLLDEMKCPEALSIKEQHFN